MIAVENIKNTFNLCKNIMTGWHFLTFILLEIIFHIIIAVCYIVHGNTLNVILCIQYFVVLAIYVTACDFILIK